MDNSILLPMVLLGYDILKAKNKENLDFEVFRTFFYEARRWQTYFRL